MSVCPSRAKKWAPPAPRSHPATGSGRSCLFYKQGVRHADSPIRPKHFTREWSFCIRKKHRPAPNPTTRTQLAQVNWCVLSSSPSALCHYARPASRLLVTMPCLRPFAALVAQQTSHTRRKWGPLLPSKTSDTTDKTPQRHPAG